jgi:hypothetical protein
VVSRRAVVVSGVLVVVAYVGLAVASGRLSPLARGPLLDGLGPPAPYRWVQPPPELAADNQEPSSGVFELTLSGDGSDAGAFVLSDNQLTLVLPKGVFPAKAGQVSIRLVIRPVDPATLGAVPDGLTVFGNAYRVRAVYVPSGDPVATVTNPMDAILVYPVTTDLSSSNHQLATSTDGRTWSVQDGTDSHALQQAEGPLPDLGYVAVVGTPGSPSPAPGSSSSSRSLATWLIVAAVCVGLIGVALIVRSRSATS